MGAGHLRSARPAPTRRDPPLPLASSNPGHKPAPSPLAHHHHPTHSSYCTLGPPPSRYPGPPSVWRLERFHARTHARQVILGDSQDPTQLQGQPRGPWDPRAPAHYSDTRVRDPSAPELWQEPLFSPYRLRSARLGGQAAPRARWTLRREEDSKTLPLAPGSAGTRVMGCTEGGGRTCSMGGQAHARGTDSHMWVLALRPGRGSGSGW